MPRERMIIYSVLPRLWGCRQTENKAYGSRSQNGCGTLDLWQDEALAYVKSLGCTHIWFIGLLEHATQEAYAGITADPAEIVKGVAGSPYAVKDYYDIAPELSDQPEQRMQDFEALVERVHRAGLKLMMDFIPNHVARTYASDAAPKGVIDLGQGDDTSKAFDPQNNFYYFPGEALHLPHSEAYHEEPARATGNDCFSPYPSRNDWYETVKLNYGVDYLGGGQYFDPIPSTWHRMRDILAFWASKGVDGFRCDMAEMVPPEFWAWALPQLKAEFPLVFLAEIYQAGRYEDYIKAGFDYLYDKVGVYDTLRAIVRGEASASDFDPVRDSVGGHQTKMCYFLENHDEQRFMSPFFSGSWGAIRPALAVMALSGSNPYLHYFAGELGEAGMDSEGFSGLDGRTTIFDFWSLASLYRLGADYKGKQLKAEEKQALDYHRQILGLAGGHSILSRGAYHGINYLQGKGYDRDRLLGFFRYNQEGAVLVLANFAKTASTAELRLSEDFLRIIGIQPNTPLACHNLLTGERSVTTLTIHASYNIPLQAEGVCILEFKAL